MIALHSDTTPRSPRKHQRLLCLVLLASATGWTARSAAQTIQNSGADRTNVQLGFVGMVTNSVLITVMGTGSTTLSSGTATSWPVHAQGTINFGTFSTLLQPPPTNGMGYRVAFPAPGAVVVASLDALIDYNGSATATLTVGRGTPAGAPPDIPLGNLRVSSPARASWTAGNQGVQVPDFGQPPYNICTATGDTTCIAAKSYLHDLAVYVPDTQPAGAFTSTILYSGTMP